MGFQGKRPSEEVSRARLFFGRLPAKSQPELLRSHKIGPAWAVSVETDSHGEKTPPTVPGLPNQHAAPCAPLLLLSPGRRRRTIVPFASRIRQNSGIRRCNPRPLSAKEMGFPAKDQAARKLRRQRQSSPQSLKAEAPDGPCGRPGPGGEQKGLTGADRGCKGLGGGAAQVTMGAGARRRLAGAPGGRGRASGAEHALSAGERGDHSGGPSGSGSGAAPPARPISRFIIARPRRAQQPALVKPPRSPRAAARQRLAPASAPSRGPGTRQHATPRHRQGGEGGPRGTRTRQGVAEKLPARFAPWGRCGWTRPPQRGCGGRRILKRL